MRNTLKSALMGLSAVLSLFASSAFAGLGSLPMSGADHHVTSAVRLSARAMAQATVPSSATPVEVDAYSVNNVTLDSGTVVREFVATSNNQVFAVSWTGPCLPHFDDILGNYSTRYLKPSSSDAVKSAGLGQRSLTSPDLVVQSFGRFGQFSGYAYLPSAIPTGVSVTQLH